MIRLLQRRLIIPRGDTGSFTVPLLSQGNTDNIAVFTIFDELTRTRLFQKIIQCEGDAMNVAFTHNDTVNLKPGKYLWDIKFYQNPQFVDEELVNGDEVDSYYAGFSLPVCEIRETADNYLVSPDAPTAMLTPEQLDIITGAISSLNEAIEKTQSNVEHYPIVRNEVWYTWDAETQDYVSTGTRARGNIGLTGTGISSVVLNDDYTLTLNLTDGTSFTSTSIRGEVGNGIDDIVLNNDYTLSIRYTDGEVYTSPSIRGAVGPAGNGIISITKTNTVNNVDTYNVNYTNGTFDSFNVTNGRDGGVTSVAGKSGDVILNSGDIEYDEQEVYNSGTVGKEVGDLKSQVEAIRTDLNGIETLVKSKNLFSNEDMTVGYLDSSTGAINSATTSRKVTDFLEVTPGKYLTFSELYANTTWRSTTAPSVCFYNRNKTAISGGGTWKLNIVVPQNATYARVCVENSRIASAYQIELTDDGVFTTYEPYYAPYYIVDENVNIPIQQIIGLNNHLDVLDESAEEIENISTALSEISEHVTYDRYDVYLGPYYENAVNPDGSIGIVATWNHTDKIPVSPGDLLYGVTTDHTNETNIPRVCAYYNDTVLPAKGKSGDTSTYTVPDGVNYVVVTQKRAGTGKVRSIEITGTNSKSKQVIPKSRIGYMRSTGDMVDGDTLYVSENNVKNQVVVAFSGNITTFGSLKIGQRNVGNTGFYDSYIEIDDTNVTVHNDQGQSVAAHGLTIADDIQIMICTEDDIATSLIRVVSKGNVYTDTVAHRWICDKGFAGIESVGSTLTDCALSWTSRNIHKPIWIFGDSYISLYPQRWIYYVIQDGFAKSCLINGYAGENSKNAMIALENLLAVDCPHYVVWCLGMNDGDSSSAVNTSWDENYRKMVSLCKQNGITPILATIPNVPTVNNNFKNAIIRSSGYRYVEFSKALDPDEDGDWIENALSVDGVHATEIGAKISYQRLLTDFPEIVSL